MECTHSLAVFGCRSTMLTVAAALCHAAIKWTDSDFASSPHLARISSCLRVARYFQYYSSLLPLKRVVIQAQCCGHLSLPVSWHVLDGNVYSRVFATIIRAIVSSPLESESYPLRFVTMTCLDPGVVLKHVFMLLKGDAWSQTSTPHPNNGALVLFSLAFSRLIISLVKGVLCNVENTLSRLPEFLYRNKAILSSCFFLWPKQHRAFDASVVTVNSTHFTTCTSLANSEQFFFFFFEKRLDAVYCRFELKFTVELNKAKNCMFCI